jgi:hypothetical protein
LCKGIRANSFWKNRRTAQRKLKGSAIGMGTGSDQLYKHSRNAFAFFSKVMKYILGKITNFPSNNALVQELGRRPLGNCLFDPYSSPSALLLGMETSALYIWSLMLRSFREAVNL